MIFALLYVALCYKEFPLNFNGSRHGTANPCNMNATWNAPLDHAWISDLGIADQPGLVNGFAGKAKVSGRWRNLVPTRSEVIPRPRLPNFPRSCAVSYSSPRRCLALASIRRADGARR